MPTDSDILGFSNPWYEEAITTAATITLDSGAEIRAATPVLLIATKLCAWRAVAEEISCEVSTSTTYASAAGGGGACTRPRSLHIAGSLSSLGRPQTDLR